MCQSWESPVQQQLPTALHSSQCNDPYAKQKKKRKGPCLWFVVHTQCDRHWISFSRSLIVGYLDSFLKGLLNCMHFVLLVLLHVILHITRDEPLSFIVLIPNSRLISNTMEQMFTFTATLDCSMGIFTTLLHTNSFIKKTRNLWFDILFTMCIITNQCVIY